MNRRILSLLLNEPDISQKDIAKRLKVSPPAITNRVQRMKKEGIIKGFVPVIDLSKLGYDLSFVVWVRIRNGKLAEAAEFFAKEDNVSVVYDITGDYDLAVFVKFKNTDEADKWSKRVLSNMDFINRTNSSFVIEAVREGTVPKDVG